MTRARETALLIARKLLYVPNYESDLLREGVPVKPEPESETWKGLVIVLGCPNNNLLDTIQALLMMPPLTILYPDLEVKWKGALSTRQAS